MPKSVGGNRKGKPRHRTFSVGQAVRVATQYDGIVFAEITEISGHVFVIRSGNGKTYRILAAEII